MLNPVWRLHLSWLVLAAGGLWGISIARNGGHGVGTSGTVQTALLTGYIALALYWGVPPFWRWWRRAWFHAHGLIGILTGGCLIRAVIAFTVLLVGGYFFSVFGGGLYQFARHWRLARYHA